MRATILTAVAVMFLFTACKKEEAEKPGNYKLTTVVTIDYGDSKVVELIYHNKLVWQSEPDVSSMTYQKSDSTDTVDIDYVRDGGVSKHVSFTAGKLNKK